jgi:hypothetical protein
MYILSRIYGCLTNNNGVWIGRFDLLITPLQSLVIIITRNKWLPKTRSILTGLRLAPFWSLSILIWIITDIWFTNVFSSELSSTDLNSVLFSSSIAYPYPRKRLLISRIHGNVFRTVGFQEFISMVICLSTSSLALSSHITIYMFKTPFSAPWNFLPPSKSQIQCV